jgi:hypothetical protein
VIAGHFARVVRIPHMRPTEQIALLVVCPGHLIGELIGHVVATKYQLPRPVHRGHRSIDAAQQPMRNRAAWPQYSRQIVWISYGGIASKGRSSRTEASYNDRHRRTTLGRARRGKLPLAPALLPRQWSRSRKKAEAFDAPDRTTAGER